MNSNAHDPAALATQSSTPGYETGLPLEPATPPSTTAEPDAQRLTSQPTLAEQCGQSPTPTAPKTVVGPGAQTLTPAPAAPKHTAVSVSGVRPALSQTATMIAKLQKQDVAAVEAALVSVREAYRRGDHSAIEEALIGQAVLLQSVGEALLALAGCDPAHLPRVQAYTALALRSFEQARKAISTLEAMRGGSRTNVQVNIGTPSPTNELEVL